MSTSRRFAASGQNRLLSALSPGVHARLLSRMEKVALPMRHTLHDADAPLAHVWFPLSGVVSLAVELKKGGTVEIGTVGNEGLIGIAAYLGADRSWNRASCQVAGELMRMRCDAFKRSLAEHPELEDLVRRYASARLNQISRSTACNHRHGVRERLCRWLLTTQDRVGAEQFSLTHDFLAQMLGVRRPSVTVAAGMLQRDRLIAYQHGRIRVLDRAGLEAGSCERYEALRQHLDRIFTSPRKAA